MKNPLSRCFGVRIPWPGVSAFVLTAAILAPVHSIVTYPMLILERLIPGTAAIEIFLLCLYAAYITEKMIRAGNTKSIRITIWTVFSVVFFSQLLLGLAGFSVFLMTGKLHLPIPALIIAGPIYRGEGFFMLILFASTLVLTGPAWCSYFCYFGVWDHIAASRKSKPAEVKPWMKSARNALFPMVIVCALLLRLFDVPVFYAMVAASLFGLAGIGIMLFISGKLGLMVHCMTYCPIGLLANLLGKISPFRMRISDTCAHCGKCRKACRYGALSPAQIEKRKPGLTCTLCGDCLDACKSRSLGYRFLWVTDERARKFFVVMVVSIHAAFLGLARI